VWGGREAVGVSLFYFVLSSLFVLDWFFFVTCLFVYLLVVVVLVGLSFLFVLFSCLYGWRLCVCVWSQVIFLISRWHIEWAIHLLCVCVCVCVCGYMCLCLCVRGCLSVKVKAKLVYWDGTLNKQCICFFLSSHLSKEKKRAKKRKYICKHRI